MFINDWGHILKEEIQKPYFQELELFLNQEYQQYTVYPKMEDRFNALHYTPYTDTKVVILGQDPYHGPNQAHGLSFSVRPMEKIPPSLKNIYKELKNDIGCEVPDHGCLVSWAKQGVLLLNTVLSVREGEPNSHKGKGWELFTDAIIRALNERNNPVIFLLWGKHAQNKRTLITNPHHVIFESVHPSPLSANRGFWGSKPFSKVNQTLMENKEEPIVWEIPMNAD
jgi:uracil-DNA glycosylase